MQANATSYRTLKPQTCKVTPKVTPKITRGWPPKRRAAQATRLQKAKIWLKSTGPKTIAGKLRVAQNALKHGRSSAAFKQQVKILRSLLKKQRAYLKQYKLQRSLHYALSYEAACQSPTYAQHVFECLHDARAS